MCATEKAVGGAAAKKAAGEMAAAVEEVVEEEEAEVEVVDGWSGRMGSKRGAFDCEKKHENEMI
jgi:hypothetical protein